MVNRIYYDTYKRKVSTSQRGYTFTLNNGYIAPSDHARLATAPRDLTWVQPTDIAVCARTGAMTRISDGAVARRIDNGAVDDAGIFSFDPPDGTLPTAEE